MNFLKNLRLSNKFLLVMLMIGVPIVLFGTLFIKSQNEDINFSQKEIHGTRYLVPLHKVLQHVSEHRAAATASFTQEAFRNRLNNIQGQVREAISEVDKVDAEFGEILESSSAWQSIKSDWTSVRSGQSGMNMQNSMRAHEALIDKLIQLVSDVGDKSNLILDPKLDSYYLMDGIVSKLPDVHHDLETLRANLMTHQHYLLMDDDSKLDIKMYIDRIGGKLRATRDSYETAFNYNGSLRNAISGDMETFIGNAESYLDQIDQGLFNTDSENRVTPELLYNEAGPVLSSWDRLYNSTAPELIRLLEDRVSELKTSLYTNLALVFVCILLALAGAFWVIRTISGPLANVINIFREIEQGNLDSEIEYGTTEETGQLLAALCNMQQTLRTQREERDQFEENARIRKGLDSVASAVMLVDVDHKVVYMNDSASKLLRKSENALRRDLPNFNAASVLGGSIGALYKDSSSQRSLFEGLTNSHSERYFVGGLTFRVTINPIFSDEGNRIGTAVEWADLTQEVAIEEEVQNIVDASRAGDLSNRINLDGKIGFQLRLSEGVNDMLKVSEGVIDEVVNMLGAMSAGNLTKRINTEYKGKYDQLKKYANELSEKLVEVIGNIQNSANAVKVASNEISQGNSNLSQRTEEQAASLEETASSMEQMTSTIMQNTDNARQANQLSSAARETAEAGGKVVSDAIGAMSDINESSKKIADIIGVINEIAFQTNLLALNASVEAARAGEQGRGFAVVAGEVRNLAGRSATAAKEIKALIEDSVANVEQGSMLVNKSGETLQEIVSSVKKVSDIVAEIAAASEEQSIGIEEINKAITQMDEMTQQNAALVEQVAAASESMGEQSADLENQTSFFSLSEDTSGRITSIKREPKPANRAANDAPLMSAGKREKRQVVNMPQSVDTEDDDWAEF